MPKLFELADTISPVQAVTVEVVANANRYGVISGCEITWNNNLTLTIADGLLLIDGVEVAFAEESFNITTRRPAGTAQRWVIITATDAGGAITSGVTEENNPPATFPKLPAVGAEAVLLAAIRLASTDNSLSAVAAADRALDHRVPSPTTRGITGLDLNEEVDVLDSDQSLGVAYSDELTVTIELTDATDKVELRLGLRLDVPAGAGNHIDYRVRRGTQTQLDEAEVDDTGAAPSGFDVHFPFYDEPATEGEVTYTVQAKRTGGAAEMLRGSYLYAREIH